MSVIIWTPTAALSEITHIDAKVWRVVEDQHRSSTVKLVDNLAEHEALEIILEKGKPPLPRGSEHLDYFLSSPFRYPQIHFGSRFRAAHDPGVFYAAMSFHTAAAELGYWRWKFLANSKGLDRLDPAAHTVFKTQISGRSIDLTEAPFNVDKDAWQNPTDYSTTQQLARTAREIGIQVIVYQSVRDPDNGTCVAVMSPTAFHSSKPDNDIQTWHLAITQKQIIWTHKFKKSFSIDTSNWIFSS